MRRFFVRRLALALLTLLLVSIAVFAASQVLPGDLGRTILGPYATNAQVAALDNELGVDRPLPVRYAEWLSGFVRGDWGVSLVQRVDVRPLVLDRFSSSLVLGGFALALVVPLSVGAGVLAATRRGTAVDTVITTAAVAFVALPEFVTGAIVLVVFAVQLGWLPVTSQVPSATDPRDWFRQLLLPSIPLMLVEFAYIARMARDGTVEALRSNWARTAVLKGLPRRTVLWRHVLRNALLPTVTVIAVQIGYLVGGLVVIETLFSYPGIGQLILTAALNHDQFVLEAAVMVTTLVYIVANVVADLLYAVLNPRVRSAET